VLRLLQGEGVEFSTHDKGEWSDESHPPGR
jgi:hypothetical protein